MRLGHPLSQYGYFREQELLSSHTGDSEPHHNGDYFPESETVRARSLPSSGVLRLKMHGAIDNCLII